MQYYEPDFEARLDAAQQKAQRILSGQVDTEEEFIISLVIVIDREKRLGIFADYYKDRTLDELIFEAELTRGVVMTPIERSEHVMSKATAADTAELSMDLASTFGDNIDEKFFSDAMEFMNSGEFKENNEENQDDR